MFTGFTLKIQIPFIESEVLVTRKTKFYLESKASFIDLRSNGSFRLFLVAWLLEYCTFSDSSMVSLKSWPWPKYIQWGTIFQKKIMFYNLTFFVLYQTVLCKYLKKIGGHHARLREKENLFRYRAQFEGNLLCFVRARTHVHALMTQKSCAAEMRNAILRNYLKVAEDSFDTCVSFTYFLKTLDPLAAKM